MITEQRHAWRIAAISITVLLLLTLILYQQTVLYLTGLWNEYKTGNYAHGYLVLAISVYLIVINRKKLAMLIPRSSYQALPAVFAASMLWLAAELVDVNVVQAVALLLLLLAVVWAVFGNQVTSILVFPILFLGFAVPIWFPLSPLLQDLAADVVYWAIRLVGVPALRQENLILLPAGTFSVEEACSGLRYLLAALTLGTLYAYLYYKTVHARVIVVLVSASAAILANIIRVFIVVYVGYETEMQHPYVHDHEMLGWYLFGGLVILLLLIDAPIQRYFVRHNSAVKPCENVRESHKPAVYKKGVFNNVLVIFSSFILLAVGPAAAYRVNSQPNEENLMIEVVLPESVGDWKLRSELSDDWMPVYHGAVNRKQVYQKADDKITLYMGCYMVQQQGRELINDLNRINNEDTWRVVYPRERLKHAGDYQVLEQLLEANDGEQRLVWYWYRVADRVVTNRYEAKLLQLVTSLAGKQQACVLAVATRLEVNQEASRNRLYDFALKNGPIEAGLFE